MGASVLEGDSLLVWTERFDLLISQNPLLQQTEQ